MISLRKLAFSFLAPIGALTIIGTGFATWTFSIGKVEVSENFQDNVNVTAEVTNGDLKILSAPDMLVFSEGTQGKNDLFDGISFYTTKEIENGANFLVKMDNGTNHKLSFAYDNSLVYFSWSDSDASTTANIISGTLTASDVVADSYLGTWTGSGYGNGPNDTYTVELTLKQANDTNVLTGSIVIKDNNSQDICNDTFTYEETKDSITVTDSTLAFRYTYDNPDLINEDDTRFKLNVELGLFLDSREGFVFKNVRLDGNTLVWEKPPGTQGSLKLFNSLTFKKNEGEEKKDYNLAIILAKEEGSLSSRITFPNLISSNPEADDASSLLDGTYSGVSLSGIPCTLKLTKNNDATYNISLEIGAMTHYLSLSDTFKAVQNKEGDKKGFFNITSSNESKVYAEGTLHMDIDDSNLKDKHYIDFTCQLANYLRYASVNVKPNEDEKYFGLRVASILGGWKFRVVINAYFTAI